MPNVMAALLYVMYQPKEKAKHRARFGWLPVSDVAAVTKPIRENRLNLLGCPQTTEPISAVTAPKFTIL